MTTNDIVSGGATSEAHRYVEHLEAELARTREEMETSREDAQAANAALARANNDLRNVLLSMQIATIFLDGEGCLRSFTPAVAGLYNVTSRDIGRPLCHFTHRFESLPPMPARERLVNGELVEDEARHEDGTWYLRRAVSYDAGSDRLDGILISFVDISAQKLAASALRISEAKYRGLLTSIDEGFCLVEMVFDDAGAPRDYIFLEINPAFVKQTGLNDALDKSMRELVPDHEEYWFEIYGGIAKTGKPRRFVEHSQPMGRWFDVYAFRHGDEVDRQVAIIFKDITEQKRIQQELAIREARYRTLFEQASVGIAKVAFDGSWIRVNPRICEILGYSSKELLKTSFLDVTHPDDRHIGLDALQRLKVGEIERFQTEKRYLRKDGSVVWCNLTTVRHVDDDGETAFLVSVVQDIDDRKKAEATRELLIDELNHRVRNMLTVVKSIASQTVRHSDTLDEFGEAFEGRVQAMATTHTLLSENKWQGSQLQSLIRGQLQHASGRGAFELEGPEISLKPKPSLALSLVFHELATNAVKYGALSSENGSIEISWRVVDDENDEQRLHLVWLETGGPPVQPPERSGFGSQLIDINIAHEFDGRIDRDFRQEGVIVTIDMPCTDGIRAYAR